MISSHKFDVHPHEDVKRTFCESIFKQSFWEDVSEETKNDYAKWLVQSFDTENHNENLIFQSFDYFRSYLNRYDMSPIRNLR